MVASKETDSNIRFVVDDFKKKYSVASTPTPDNRGFLEKTTDVIKHSPLGIVAPLGEAVGRSIGAIGESIKTHSLDPLLNAGEQNNANYGKVVGSAVGSAALPASLAVGGGATIAANAARFGGMAAVSGGAESLGQGNDLKTAAIDSFKSGLTGAAVGVATKVASNAIQKVASKAPESLYNNSLKVLQKIKTAGKSPSDFLHKEGVWGNLGAFKKAATEGMAAENAVIKQAAANAKGGLRYEEIGGAAIKKLQQDLGDLYTPQQIRQLVEKVPVARLSSSKGVVPWVDADGIRSSLGTLIGDSKWLTTTPSEQTKAAQAVYGALSDAIKKATGTTENFARYSKWIQTNKIVDRALGLADSKYGYGLYDAISGTGGAVVGFGSGDSVGERLKNAAIGGVTGVALERGVNSPALKTATAQVLSHLGDLPTDSLGRVSRAAVIDLIGRLMATTPADQQEGQ